MTQEIVLILLVFLVVHRVTRSVTADRVPFGDIREHLQEWFENRWLAKRHREEDPDNWLSKMSYFLTCPWCVSIWVSAAVTLTVDLAHGLEFPWLVWLAASSVTGILESRE